MSDELAGFVREALAKGKSKEEIRGILREAGWQRDAVDKALDAWADVAFAVPVPRPRPYVSAGEAFFYLVLFTTLYASAISFGSIVFGIIEFFIPDPAQPDYVPGLVGGIRWSASWLLISFPVFLWLSWRAHLSLRRDPEKRTSKVRKWLTYLTLFVAAVVIIGDLVTLVFNLLAGELTLRFVLKVLTVGAIAAAVFGHYSRNLREDDLGPDQLPARRPGLRLFAGTVAVAVVAALVAGLVIAGSPLDARARRLDDQRVSDLRSIADAADDYWKQHEALPPDLETLAQERAVRVRSIRDPQTDTPYEYRILGERQYELCATFDLAHPEAHPRTTYRDPDSRWGRWDERFWDHGPGRTCFEIEVRKDD